jgi:hypothetical protein
MSHEREKTDGRPNRWPFDPMQPGDHEPVRLPEHLEHEPTAPPTPPAKEKSR